MSYKSSVEILYEDENFLAVNKPAGMLVHGVKGKHEKTEPNLVDWVIENRPEIKNVGDAQPHTGQAGADRPGIVHRLDRQTSGVMLIAKNQEYFSYLKNLFQTKEIKKIYLAIVHGTLTGEGRIDKPIGLKDGSVKRTVHVIARNTKMIREAVTLYKAVKPLDIKLKGAKDVAEFTLVELTPLTGRTHQIRVHMASIGHPVLGDELYGGKNDKLPRHYLHADSIEFSTISGKRIKLSAALPEDFQGLVDQNGQVR
ncbi:MAG: hypothetical protein A3B23_00840 [Candidatus Colwellbacteria bacterium RIFCSPLOWO2_01_FULL_48_10]|uniref:Pseudouridine synthase RsuA/RluA-like domain-containing protein n=2 Tax=Bacteria candidate phyla TaxID=1783234 RepID=A0A1F5P456_9BACT|nr:MAG: hypothetical protein A2846_04130 [Candidatus Doudnabacteria bacterium RIFCSPHIGHO2_01_FULL_49_9]OGY59493.1 MAG: hypothetical protein A3B23_00840 [Candidatus Colwellbacteria bacterium RIFCSPLOWO2_01_FULL_48_10]